MAIEYSITPVVVYVLSEFTSDENSVSGMYISEFDDIETAREVATYYAEKNGGTVVESFEALDIEPAE